MKSESGFNLAIASQPFVIDKCPNIEFQIQNSYQTILPWWNSRMIQNSYDIAVLWWNSRIIYSCYQITAPLWNSRIVQNSYEIIVLWQGSTHFLWDTRDHSEDEAVREAYCYSQARSPKDQRGSKNLPRKILGTVFLETARSLMNI